MTRFQRGVAVAAQVIGAVSVMAAVFLLLGLAWSLLVGGLLLVAGGTAREAGWL